MSPVRPPPARHRQPRIDTAAPLLCHYASDPARRPACTLTAEVLTGQIALCRPCAQARSTLGKGTPPLPLPPAPGKTAGPGPRSQAGSASPGRPPSNASEVILR